MKVSALNETLEFLFVRSFLKQPSPFIFFSLLAYTIFARVQFFVFFLVKQRLYTVILLVGRLYSTFEKLLKRQFWETYNKSMNEIVPRNENNKHKDSNLAFIVERILFAASIPWSMPWKIRRRKVTKPPKSLVMKNLTLSMTFKFQQDTFLREMRKIHIIFLFALFQFFWWKMWRKN